MRVRHGSNIDIALAQRQQPIPTYPDPALRIGSLFISRKRDMAITDIITHLDDE